MKPIRRKTFSSFVIIVCLLVFVLPAAFSQGPVPAAKDSFIIIDNAELLTPGQKSDLTSFGNYLAGLHKVTLIIVTETSIGAGPPKEYADAAIDRLCETGNGCLFLQVTGGRDYAVSTIGTGKRILNSYAYRHLIDAVRPRLTEGNYFEVYKDFLFCWEEYLILNAEGRTYSFFHKRNMILVIVGWVIAFGIGCIIVQVWKKGMNTALPATQAAAYIVPGSLDFKEKKDRFLYTVVTKTERPKQSSGGSGSSGGSHGGGSGKY